MKSVSAKLSLLIGATFALSSLSSDAAELVSVRVEKNGKRYLVDSVSTYTASRESLIHILTDYENFDRVSSVFKESYYLAENADGIARAYTRLEGCVWFFCQSIERIDQIFVDPDRVVAISEPENSDFKYSRGEWRFDTTDSGEKIVYQLEMEPDFWVPPLIGPYMLKKRLAEGAVDAVQRVEKLAIERDSSR